MVEAELRSIRNFVTAANILIIVSIFIAGIPLGIIAIICTLIAWSKFKKLIASEKIEKSLELFYARKIGMVMILSFIIFAINCVSAYMYYPHIVEQVNQYFNGGSGISSVSNGVNNGSIWG